VILIADSFSTDNSIYFMPVQKSIHELSSFTFFYVYLLCGRSSLVLIIPTDRMNHQDKIY